MVTPADPLFDESAPNKLEADTMDGRATLPARQWPKLLVGGVLLWRALTVTALGASLYLPDERVLHEWTSPGINRCLKLTFSPGTGDASD